MADDEADAQRSSLDRMANGHSMLFLSGLSEFYYKAAQLAAIEFLALPWTVGEGRKQ